jgi:uncharacterized protein YjbI with pentapeptide repeats
MSIAMANPDHLALVRSGVDALNEFCRRNEDLALDLEGADLSEMDLRNARLQAARLAGANFERADLRNVRFNSGDLRNANFRDADLRGASLHRANITGADLRGAKFETLGLGGQRMCISPESFEAVHWERDEIARILEMINLNPDWEVRYEIVERPNAAGQVST